ncbi:M20/M25/M40 family metallo-hydrolase [Lachnospiraceae bacterium CLA-AA-H215]|uniref:M20/M25/M40 family metallo-hydrolase n=2 Tax=Hominifimenecus microfluidus TaxID=2885348 RepID=A0AAE3EB29_9FIRM|nr:M20/M25/M40 family metallo-hydrolase [Hominifimenecus microfluidus]MCC2231357.1 M20/M25/M40 family metallo-hydrolase [Hominifimenecus microfluidus]
MPEAYQDEAGNVIFEYGTGEEVVICMAHMDVVFPDTTPFTIQERDGLWYTPGILDDNANLVCMLMAARYIVKHQIPFPYRLVFVANVCEEGLGNLKGSKAIRDTFGSSIRRFIGFDAQLHDIVNHAVGSMRFRVTVRTEGGHSYTAFGNHNAIHQLAELICELYQVQVPTEARTTYNVGTIEGGTTVNSIAQQASMLYEFRSESVECLEKMQRTFDRIIEKYRHLGRSIEVETIGIRPCMKGVDPAAQEQLEEMGADLIRTYTDREPKRRTGSTDANTFQAYGIPSIVLGTAIGGSTHTREEWLDPKSLKEGLRLALGAVWQIW